MGSLPASAPPALAGEFPIFVVVVQSLCHVQLLATP